MGFDICGLDPVNETGSYFRNTIWYWEKLWSFVCILNQDILKEDEIESGFANDGTKIGKRKAKKIAERLEKALNEKDKYSAEWIKNLKLPGSESLEEFCKDIFNELVSPDKSVENDKSKDEADFPFDWENIREFMEFAKNSGGFEIY